MKGSSVTHYAREVRLENKICRLGTFIQEFKRVLSKENIDLDEDTMIIKGETKIDKYCSKNAFSEWLIMSGELIIRKTDFLIEYLH